MDTVLPAMELASSAFEAMPTCLFSQAGVPIWTALAASPTCRPSTITTTGAFETRLADAAATVRSCASCWVLAHKIPQPSDRSVSTSRTASGLVVATTIWRWTTGNEQTEIARVPQEHCVAWAVRVNYHTRTRRVNNLNDLWSQLIGVRSGHKNGRQATLGFPQLNDRGGHC